MSKKFLWGTSELSYIASQKALAKTWAQITDGFNLYFHQDLTLNAIRKAYNYHLAGTDQAIDAKLLQATRQARKTNAKVSRENAIALDALNAQDDLLEEIKNLVQAMPETPKVDIPAVQNVFGKRTAFELMLSDIHFGKKTKDVNLRVLRERMRQFASVSVFQICAEAEVYDVSEVIINCIGDLIESSTMHGPESLIGCEFTNAKQVAVAIKSIYEDFIVPIADLQAKLGFKLKFIGVPGNHDRFGKNKTFHNPGEERLTYTIYKTLEFICEKQGLDIEFNIPSTSYATFEIFGSLWLSEHGDKIPLNRAGMEKHLGARSAQLGRQLTGMRCGHYHEHVCWGRGRFIVNESVVGQDSYADELGYNSCAGQTIVQYVETENRNNPFYRCTPVYLGNKKEDQ